MNVEELLKDNGIRLKGTSSGRYYLTCPQCSASRSRAHQNLECLGITIKGDTVHWGCNHCGWKGPEKGATNGAGDTRKPNGTANGHYHKTSSSSSSAPKREEPRSEDDYIIDWKNPQEFICENESGRGIYQNVRFPLLNRDGSTRLSHKGKPDKT